SPSAGCRADPPLTTPTVLLVHAHPDDESIATGGTMAHLVRAGARVVLLTATRGEGGEVIGEELDGLEGDRAGLAAHREQELAGALQALGVTEHWYLGQSAPEAAAGFPARRFEDSGMVWGEDGHAHAPATMPPDAFCAADPDDVAARVSAVVEAVDPHLVLAYGADGGYGHPDHRRGPDLRRDRARLRRHGLPARRGPFHHRGRGPRGRGPGRRGRAGAEGNGDGRARHPGHGRRRLLRPVEPDRPADRHGRALRAGGLREERGRTRAGTAGRHGRRDRAAGTRPFPGRAGTGHRDRRTPAR